MRDLLRAVRRGAGLGPPPFQGGAAGYIGYDYGARARAAAGARATTTSAIPDVVLGLYDWVIAWDHRLGTAWIVSTGLPETGAAREAARARERLAMVRERLRGPARPAPRPADAAGTRRARPGRQRRPTRSLGVEGAEAIGLRSTFTHRGYLDAVARVREYIVAGDIFQANLSQRFQAPLGEPPFDLYRRLRRRNPAAVRAPISTSTTCRVLSASPERFLRLDENGATSRPARSRAPGRAGWARCTMRRWAGRSPRATRTGPRT